MNQRSTPNSRPRGGKRQPRSAPRKRERRASARIHVGASRSQSATVRLRRRFGWAFGTRPSVLSAVYLLLAVLLYLHALSIDDPAIRGHLLLAASAMLALLVLAIFGARRNMGGLDVSRTLPRAVRAGQPFTVTHRLINRRRWLPACLISLREDELDTMASQPGGELAAYIGPGRATTLQSEFSLLRRGRFYFHGVETSSSFPIGLVKANARAALEQEVLVYPRVVPLPASLLALALHPSLGFEEYRSRSRGMSEPAGTREYRPGDPINRIHWPTTARVGEAMVMEFEHGSERRMTILLDAYSKERSRWDRAGLEQMVCLATSLVHHLYADGVSVGLALNQEEGLLSLPPSTIGRNYHGVMEHLANTGFAPKPLAAWMHDVEIARYRSSVVVITLADTPSGFEEQALPQDWHHLSVRHAEIQRVIFQNVGDEHTITFRATRFKAKT